MHRHSARVAAVLVVLGTLMAVALAMRAQAAAASGQDILPALLAEVRGLRQAMEQMASAGPRVELALGRLQLQEQRINALIRRVESVRDQRTSAERQLEMQQFQMKTMGAAAEQVDPAERKQMEFMEAQVKAELSRLSSEIQRLTAEEADLSAQIASEQARWTAINQQVEELERSLGRR